MDGKNVKNADISLQYTYIYKAAKRLKFSILYKNIYFLYFKLFH